MFLIELSSLPSKKVLEAYLSGSVGGPNSFGGDGRGPMVLIDLEKQAMVPEPDFRERWKAWEKTGKPNPCPLQRRPTLSVLNALLNHKGAFYNPNKHLIFNRSGVASRVSPIDILCYSLMNLPILPQKVFAGFRRLLGRV